MAWSRAARKTTRIDGIEATIARETRRKQAAFEQAITSEQPSGPEQAITAE
jgi:hypothetical protein